MEVPDAVATKLEFAVGMMPRVNPVGPDVSPQICSSAIYARLGAASPPLVESSL